MLGEAEFALQSCSPPEDMGCEGIFYAVEINSATGELAWHKASQHKIISLVLVVATAAQNFVFFHMWAFSLFGIVLLPC